MFLRFSLGVLAVLLFVPCVMFATPQLMTYYGPGKPFDAFVLAFTLTNVMFWLGAAGGCAIVLYDGHHFLKRLGVMH